MVDIYPLHDVPKYMNECAEILNEEWKRSLTARLHSLEKSRDSLPVCLALLMKDEAGETRVIGHSRLSDIRGQTTKSCLVESVVVKKSLRGKGYGRVIMEKTEEYALSKGYQLMYLTTHDKQNFYEHLGYKYCQPVVSFGSDILPEHLAQKLIGSLTISNDQEKVKDVKPDNISRTDNSGKDSTHVNTSLLVQKVPPPAPPPPQAPPPPVAPPPPPPPPAVSAGTNTTSGKDTVVRWDPAKISWMKKSLT